MRQSKFLEAMVVAMVDDLDSKIDSLTQILKSEMGNADGWTRYNAQYDRYFYTQVLKDTLKDGEA